MKTIILFKIIFLTTIITGFSTFVKSQNCNMYYSLVDGNEYEMTNYDSKNNIDGKTINKISNVVTTAEGTMAIVNTTTKDKKDEVVTTSSSSVKCAGDKMYFEIKSFIPSKPMAQMNNMTIKSDASLMELPQNLNIGMALKDASGVISLFNNGTLITTMKITITDRKVVSNENITTAAGTFNCFKITQNFNMETTTMGYSLSTNIINSEYYAAGTGSVKTESYDKDGKLMGYSLLTKITKL